MMSRWYRDDLPVKGELTAARQGGRRCTFRLTAKFRFPPPPLFLGVSPSRIYQFAARGRLRRLKGVAPAKWGRKHCVMFDLLEVAALAEQRAASPPRPGRPRKGEQR